MRVCCAILSIIIMFLLYLGCSGSRIDWDDSDLTNSTTTIHGLDIRFTQPASNLIISSNSFAVTGTASGLTEIEEIYFSADNGLNFGIANGTLNWDTNLSALFEGDHYLMAYALDVNGKSSLTDYVLLRVADPPTLIVTQPVSNITTTNSYYLVMGTAADNTALDGVYLSTDNGTNFYSVPVVSSNWQTNIQPLHVGDNFIKVYAMDAASNTSPTNSFKIQVIGPPELEIRDPLGFLLLTVDSYKVSGIVRDNGAVTNILFSADGGSSFAPVTLAQNWSTNLSFLTQGSNIIQAYAIDDEALSSITDQVVIQVLREKFLTNSSITVNNEFGISVDISDDGERLIGGAHKQGPGVAYIFKKSGGGVWQLSATFTNDDAGTDDEFGGAVAMSGDGNFVVVGAPEHGIGRGAAYVFTNDGVNWDYAQKLEGTNTVDSNKLGTSVTISDDGSLIAVGAPGENRNSVYIFTNAGTLWNQGQILHPAEVSNLSYFGTSLSLSVDSQVLAVGARFHDNYGTVFIYTNNNGIWSQVDKVIAPDPESGLDNFGQDVALSGDGSVLLVGNHRDDSFRGAAYIFERSGDSWNYSVKLTLTNRQTNDNLGTCVALSANGSRAFVGARKRDIGGNVNQGAVYLFNEPQSGWGAFQSYSQIIAGNGVADDEYGVDVAVSDDGHFFTVGAYRQDSGEGAVYSYE